MQRCRGHTALYNAAQTSVPPSCSTTYAKYSSLTGNVSLVASTVYRSRDLTKSANDTRFAEHFALCDADCVLSRRKKWISQRE
jgi:hypothetical protein